MKRENTVIRPAARRNAARFSAARHNARLPFRPALILLLAAALLLPALTLTLTGCDIADFIGKPATSSGELPDGDGSGTLPETYPVVTDAPVPSVSPALADDGTPRTTEDGRPVFTVKDGEGNVITGTDGAAAEVFFRTALEGKKPVTTVYYAATGEAVTVNGEPLVIKTVAATVGGETVMVAAGADGTPAFDADGGVSVVVTAAEVDEMERKCETTYTDDGGFKTTYTLAQILPDRWQELLDKYGIEETIESTRSADWRAMQQDYLYANLSKGNAVRWLSYLGSRLPSASYEYDITLYNEDGVPLFRAVYTNREFFMLAFVYNTKTQKYEDLLIEGYAGYQKFVRNQNGNLVVLNNTGQSADQEAIKFANEYNAVFLNFEPEDATMTANTAEKLSWVLTNNSGDKLFIDYDVISQKPTFYAVLDGVRYNFEAKSGSKITFNIADYLTPVESTQ